MRVTRVRLAGLRLAGWVAMAQHDVDAGVTMFEEAGRLVEEVGDAADEAYLTSRRGLAAFFTGDLEQAATLTESALAGFRREDDVNGELFCLFLHGLTRGLSGEHAAGLAQLEEAILGSARIDDVYWRGWATWAVGVIEAMVGNLESAEKAAKEALAFHRKLDNRVGMAVTVDTLAGVAAKTGMHARAAMLFGVADRLAHEVGNDAARNGRLGSLHDEHEGNARASLGAEAYAEAFGRGRALPDDIALDLALEVEPHQSLDTTELRDGVLGPLSPREREVAELVATGLTNRDIAGQLVVSTRTVDSHVENILRKLGFRSRTEIIAWISAHQSQR